MKLRRPIEKKYHRKKMKELWFMKLGIKVTISWGRSVKRKDLTIGVIA